MTNGEEKEKPNKLEDIASKLEETLEKSEELEHHIDHAYRTTIEKYGLHKNECAFNDKQKDELIDSIIYKLKTHLIEAGKIKDYESVDEEMWDETIMPAYFGMSRRLLKDAWKKKKRITKEDIATIVRTAEDTFVKKLHGNATADLKYEDIEPGKKHLKQISDEYKLGIDTSEIKELSDLKNELINAYLNKRAFDLREKYAKKEGGEKT